MSTENEQQCNLTCVRQLIYKGNCQNRVVLLRSIYKEAEIKNFIYTVILIHDNLYYLYSRHKPYHVIYAFTYEFSFLFLSFYIITYMIKKISTLQNYGWIKKRNDTETKRPLLKRWAENWGIEEDGPNHWIGHSNLLFQFK